MSDNTAMRNMPKTPRIETLAGLKQAPVVGQFYMVPCVYFNGWYLPVLDNLHTDEEIAPHIGPHYHYDWRFMGEELVWESFSIARKNSDAPSALCVAKVYDLADPRTKNDTPVWRRKKCLRATASFPIYLSAVTEIAAGIGPHQRFQALTFKVEQLCAGKRIDPENPVCAHRGIPLGDIPPDADGCVTCPGHGLKWNLSTGEIVPRYTAGEEEEAYYSGKSIIVRAQTKEVTA